MVHYQIIRFSNTALTIFDFFPIDTYIFNIYRFFGFEVAKVVANNLFASFFIGLQIGS